jgi:hypothetical protein
MSSETDLSRNQAIHNQRNSFLRGFPIAIQRGNAASIRGTFQDSALLLESFANQKCYVIMLFNNNLFFIKIPT